MKRMKEKTITLKTIVLLFILTIILVNCNDGTSPSTVALSLTEISYNGDTVIIEWTDSDYSYVQITYSDSTTTLSVTTTSTGYSFSNLNSNTEYTFSLIAVDIGGNESNEVSITLSTDIKDSEYTFLTLIETADELSNIRNDLDGNYILIEDINLSESNSGGWTPIGDSESDSFTGILYGNNHIVSNLFIDTSDHDHGLFGYINDATISHLGLEKLEVKGGGSTGGLVGENHSGKITDTYVTGTVSGGSSTGGLVGENYEGTIRNCYSSVTVSSEGVSTGGLIGYDFLGFISYSYATGTVKGDYYTGGLVGRKNSGTVTACYAIGTVDGRDSTGGLIGMIHQGFIKLCYATGSVNGEERTGGLVGYNFAGTISYCYYDQETTEQNDENGGTATLTADMKKQETYGNSWDFTDTWAILADTNDGYPYLQNNEPAE